MSVGRGEEAKAARINRRRWREVRFKSAHWAGDIPDLSLTAARVKQIRYWGERSAHTIGVDTPEISGYEGHMGMIDAIDPAPQREQEGDSERSSEVLSIWSQEFIFILQIMPTSSAVYIIISSKLPHPYKPTGAIYTTTERPELCRGS